MSPASDLHVALLQGDTAWHDPEANRRTYGELIAQLPRDTDLVVLPETFTSGFSNDALERAEDMTGPSVAWMLERSRELDAVITGSIQIRDAGGVYNRMIWARPDGSTSWYDKRHLFRMAREHERYAGGRARQIFEVRGWQVCPLVCYDLRFPVFSRNRHGKTVADRFDYDLLIYVANWPAVRRNAWSTLLRARAIENLSYVVGVNRVGRDGNAIDYAGDSVALDFVGQSLVECGPQLQVVRATLSATALQAHRDRFPAYLDADNFDLSE